MRIVAVNWAVPIARAIPTICSCDFANSSADVESETGLRTKRNIVSSDDVQSTRAPITVVSDAVIVMRNETLSATTIVSGQSMGCIVARLSGDSSCDMQAPHTP